MSAFGNYQLAYWLDLLQREDTYLGLAFDDPGAATDPLAVEHTSTAYSRPKATWARPSPRLLRQTRHCTWQGLPVGAPVRAVMGFTAATNGSMRFYVYEPNGAVVPPGGAYVVPADILYVGLDS